MKNSTDDGMTALELYQIFRRRSRIFWGIVAVSLAIAIVLCIVKTRRYESTATIQIGKESSDALGLDSLMGSVPASDAADPLQTDINIETQVSVLKSDRLALQTINALRLQNTYDFQPRFSLPEWLSGWSLPDASTGTVNPTPENSPLLRSHLLKIFSHRLNVKAVPGTRLIDISYLSSDPKTAADVTNTLAQELIDYTYRTRSEATAKDSDWLSAQMDGLRKNSVDLQTQVAAMQSDSGVYSLGATDAAGHEQAYSGVLDRLQQDTVALTESIQNRVLKGAVFQAVKSGDPESLSGLAGNSLSSGGTNGTNNSLIVIQNLRTQEGILSAQIQQDKVKFGAAYPKLDEENASLAGIDNAIHEESDRLARRARSDYDIALATENSTRKEYETQKADANRLNEKSIQYAIVRQQAVDSTALYEDLQKKLEEAGLLQGLQSTNITVVDKGLTPAKPSVPNVPLYLAAAVCCGMLLGAASAIIADRVDNRLQEPEEIERLGIPLIGLIPMFQAVPGTEGELQVVCSPQTPYSESINTLCSRLLLLTSEEQSKVFLVTSAIPGEGKSTLSANIAAGFALQGKKVLFVEADMRHQSLGRRLGLLRTEGLSSLLTSDRETAHPIARPQIPNLFMLAAGSHPPFPSTLLGSPRMKGLAQAWREEYDIIVFDGPPVLPVVDALILSKRVDMTIQVARLGMTSRTALRRANHILQAHSKRSVGVVVNAVSPRSGVLDGYYGYKQSNYMGSYANDEIA